MSMEKFYEVFGRIIAGVMRMWPYALFAFVIALAVAGVCEWYRGSKYFKTPWEKREAKDAKKRAREEERARKAFWYGK